MKCPFKSQTRYERTRRTETAEYNEETGKYEKTGLWVNEVVSCTAKEAHTVTYDFGNCDQEQCPHFGFGAGCTKVNRNGK